MPWSRVRQSGSCTGHPSVETVSRPSYTLCHLDAGILSTLPFLE
jgi:hypothetical protein